MMHQQQQNQQEDNNVNNKLWTLSFKTTYENIAILDILFEDDAIALSSYEISPNKMHANKNSTITVESNSSDVWMYVAYFDHPPLDKYKNLSEYALSDITILENEEKDWVQITQEEFIPIHVPPFWITSHYHLHNIPVDCLSIIIDPSLAFGTGAHKTTQGCIEAISTYVTKTPEISVQSVLDIGTGTGILAIAAKKLLPHAYVQAVDIDPIAVQIAHENAIINNVDIDISTPKIEYNHTFDLIVANILLQPLIDMRDTIISITNDNGVIILSGFLYDQVDEIIERYTSKDGDTSEYIIIIDNIITHDGWSTIMFTKCVTA
jgi:ribosomal protein L11 methyltransferase